MAIKIPIAYDMPKVIYDDGTEQTYPRSLSGDGTGVDLSQEEKDLILSLFDKAAYLVDASADYDALKTLWSTSTNTVTYNLTNCVSSNTETILESGSSYSTVLSVQEGYELKTVTVLMGGVDVTSAVYSNGTITIAEVTGNIVITAIASDTTAQIATEGYVSEHTGVGTAPANYKQTAKTYGGITIKYQLDSATTSLQLAGIIPYADSTISKGVGCLIAYDSNDTIVNHLDEQSNTSPNRWAQLASGTTTEYVSQLYTIESYSQITFSLDIRYLDDAYMYDYVTGQVFFAGANTPYYGMHNVSEAGS